VRSGSGSSNHESGGAYSMIRALRRNTSACQWNHADPAIDGSTYAPTKNDSPVAIWPYISSFLFSPNRLFSPNPTPPPLLVGWLYAVGAITHECLSFARMCSRTPPGTVS
jgi:hypothetical protein